MDGSGKAGRKPEPSERTGGHLQTDVPPAELAACYQLDTPRYVYGGHEYELRYLGELLQGVQVHIMDFGKAPLSDLQFLVMQEVAALYPDRAVFDHADKGRFNMFDKVSGSRQIRERFSKRNRWEDIRDYWYKDAEDFRKLSKKYYLYK